MAATTLSLCFTTPSSSSTLLLKHNPQFAAPAKRFVQCSVDTSFGSLGVVAGRRSRARVLAAVVDEEAAVAEGGEPQNDGVSDDEGQWKMPRPTEVYVCNLPRSCDAEQLLHMFKPHGTILSVEVCRNAETGESRGCAYVTMGSIHSARNAVTALDGTDVGGREMRVRFSVEMNARRRNPETMNSSPKRVIYYEAPHKLYVGNLSRVVRPEDLRHLFSKFGNVASVRVLQDQKQGRNRVYAFLSFLSERERDAALTLNGTEFGGRTLVLREGVERSDS